MTSRDEPTKDRIIAAAEILFAQEGINGVSLRRINKDAGAKNVNAVQYHFGNRSGLLRAVVAKHQIEIDEFRHRLLDEYEANGVDDIRSLAKAWVCPLAMKLSDPRGGAAFLRIYGEIISRPQHVPKPPLDLQNSVLRWRVIIEPLLPYDSLRMHRRLTAMRFAAIELANRASSGPHTDNRLFISYVIDVAAGILLIPNSEQTIRLADERDLALNGSTSLAPDHTVEIA
jgi:AcrR family transcriptional regulator